MSEICSRVRRNKRKLIYLAGIFGSGYAIYKITRYVQNFTNKYQSDRNLQLKILKGQYFQAMLFNSLNSIEIILKNIENEIELTIDIDDVSSSLGILLESSSQLVIRDKEKYACLSADRKLELWKKFTVLSFTKITLLIYCWAFICVTMHIQMSILAGNLFHPKQESCESFNIFSFCYDMIFPTQRKTSVDEKFQIEFINFTLKHIKVHMSHWTELINKVTNRIVGSISLKKPLSSDDVLDILTQIKDGVHNDILELFLQSLQVQTSTKLLEANFYALLTSVFESSGIGHVNAFFAVVMKQVASCLDQKIKNSKRLNTETDTASKIPLVTLVPFIWSAFISEDNKMSLVNSLRVFVCNPKFRFMLYSTYGNLLDQVDQ